MRSILDVLAASLLLLSALPASAATETPVGRYLWEVRAPGSARPDYLFGSMHIALEPTERIPQAVLDRLKASNSFVMEVDLAGAESIAAKYIVLDRGNRLQQMLPPAAWKKLVDLRPSGLGPEILDHLKPWAIYSNFTWPKRGSGLPLDELLKQQAVSAGIAPSYLETAEEQMVMLDGMDDREDYALLLEVLLDPEEGAARSSRLELAYLSGDVGRLEAAAFEPSKMRMFPTWYERMFYDRNQKWLPALESRMRGGDAFVAVGAGHLIGPRGVLKLLEAKGCQITRVPL